MADALNDGALSVDGQLSWRGVTLGSGTPYGLIALTGWLDLPGQRVSNPPIPSQHGSYPGRQLSGSRTVTFDFKTKNVGLADFRAAMTVLRRITSPDEDPQEEPLAVRLDGETWMVWARCTRRFIPTDRHYGLGYAEGAIQWEATDPRLYSLEEIVLAAPPPSPPASGLDFGAGGLDFGAGGLDFGAGRSGGLIRATNLGDVASWPVLELTGPIVAPVITFPGDRVLRFDDSFELFAGQTLRIDTRPGVRTVEIYGVSVRSRLITRQWTPLMPGDETAIRYSGSYSTPDARLAVRFRHTKH